MWHSTFILSSPTLVIQAFLSHESQFKLATKISFSSPLFVLLVPFLACDLIIIVDHFDSRHA
jgi:hypothetical protein